VPAALLAGVVMMLLGHIAGGLALSGASILAAAVAVVIAALSGVRQLRKLAGQRGYRAVQLRRGDYHFG
jgi:multisubunit Na+/H+ antiporter MnhB subunit